MHGILGETRLRSRWLLLAGLCLPGLQANLRGQDQPSPAPAFAYDTSTIAWTKEELPIRIVAARWLCHDGDYEVALATLPTVDSAAAGAAPEPQLALAGRIRERVNEAIRLRTLLLQRVQADKLRLAPLFDGKRRGGRLLGHSAATLTLLDDKGTFELPMSALTAANLDNELKRHQLLRADSWQAAWLRWLAGEEATKTLGLMQDQSATAVELRADLTGRLTADASQAAAEMARALALTPATAPADAYRQMEWLVEAIGRHRSTSLFGDRLAGLKECLKTLARRAFSLSDPRCLPCSVELQRADDGRFTAIYLGNLPSLVKDFHYNALFTNACLAGWGDLATNLNTFATKDTVTEIAGRGVYTWGMPVRGALTMEMLFDIAGGGRWGLLMSTRDDGAMLRVTMAGVITIWDPKTQLSDEVGQSQPVTTGEINRLRLEFDGKGKVTTYLNNQKVAEVTRVGTLDRGYPALMSHCSMPMHVHYLKISGYLDPAGTEKLRGPFVESVLDRVR